MRPTRPAPPPPPPRKTSPHERLHPPHERVRDPHPVHRHHLRRKPLRVEPAQLERLVAAREHAADDAALEARADVVDDVAVGVGDDLAVRGGGVDAEETGGALGRGALATVAGDVSDPDDCERAVAETLARFGRLDILLNSAGTGAMGRVWDLEPLVWDRVLAVNLRGTFLLTRAASRWMVEQKRPGASST